MVYIWFSFSLSVAVRSIALLSGTWCLRRKAQHEAPAAEMVARGCIDDIVRDFYCSVQSPAFYAYCCFRWIGTNRATSDYRVALLRCLEVYLVVVLQSRSVFSFKRICLEQGADRSMPSLLWICVRRSRFHCARRKDGTCTVRDACSYQGRRIILQLRLSGTHIHVADYIYTL